jgi:hypothetical protein
MVKKLIESDNLEVEELEKPEEMNIDNTKFKEMYVYDPKNKTIKTVVQKKQTRKHFNQDKMKEHMEKMRDARKYKDKPKTAQQQPTQQPQQQQPPQQAQPDLTNIRDLIRSELLNHLPKTKATAEPEESPKKIEVEKVKPKRSRRPVQKLEAQEPVENKAIEIPKSFIPRDYVSPSFSIFGY